MKKHLLILALLALATAGLAQQSNKSKSKDRYREKDQPAQAEVRDAIDRFGALRSLAEHELPAVTRMLTEIAQQDAAIPAVSSRYLAYALLAGYETTARYQPKVSSLHGIVNAMPVMQSFVPADSVFHPFASLWAILETGKQLMPFSSMLLEKQNALEQAFRQNGLSDRIISLSKTAAADISQTVVAFSRTDGFDRIADISRSRAAFNPTSTQDIPPVSDLNELLLRPFIIESVQPFALSNPMPFDTSAGSAFMGMTREVYDLGKKQTQEQRAIAEFWNAGGGKAPLAGHWLTICGLVCTQQQTPFNLAIRAHAALALTLSDAYLLCWEENNRNRRVRPQTVINRLIDLQWRPLLSGFSTQEYASDYSVASSAAAEVLTHFLGDNSVFLDNTGAPARRYTSFRKAAEEASVSRLYGGIQFRDALQAGTESGRRLGAWALQRWPKEQ